MHAPWRWVAAVVLLAGSLAATDASAQEPASAAGAAPAVAGASTARADGAARDLDRVAQDVELLKERIEAQNQRFDVQTTQLDRTVGWFQTFLTVLGALLGLAGVGAYFSVQRKAKDEAEKAAREWFEDRAGAFEKRLAELAVKEEQLRVALALVEGDASSARKRMLDSEKEVKQQAEVAKRNIQAAFQSTVSEAEKPAADTPPPAVPHVPDAAAAALQQVAHDLSQKPPAEYTLGDWDDLAFAAFQAGDRERAVVYWESAARCSGDAVDIARVLFNRGLVLSQMDAVLMRLSFTMNLLPALVLLWTRNCACRWQRRC